MVDIIIDRLYNNGYSLFFTKLFEKNDISCIIPNFEYFHLVAEGIGVLPNIYNYNKIIEDNKGENL